MWEEMRDLMRTRGNPSFEVVARVDDVAEAESAAKPRPEHVAFEPYRLSMDGMEHSPRPEIIGEAQGQVG